MVGMAQARLCPPYGMRDAFMQVIDPRDTAPEQ
jgi:hypothetical protein